MAIGGKPDFAPLLAPGRHSMTLVALKELCVDAFPLSKRREALYWKLEEFIQKLLAANIPCHVWIDGSFLTKKEEPDDVDASVMLEPDVSEALTPEQRAVVDDIDDYVGVSPRVDSFVFVWKRRDDPLWGYDLADPANGWHEVYGAEHSKRWLKGFAVIKLGETGVGLRICS